MSKYRIVRYSDGKFQVQSKLWLLFIPIWQNHLDAYKTYAEALEKLEWLINYEKRIKEEKKRTIMKIFEV